MKLIIGLGNPGSKYESTWHNIGFLAVDQLQKNGFNKWKSNTKHKVNGAEGIIAEKKVILIKPLTYMNNSGQAALMVANFYKIKIKDIIVIHDELDLPLGKIRISTNSSAAGHNGIKSIIQHLGSQNFIRVRIGVKPAQELKMPADKYVLKKIGLKDRITIKRIITGQIPNLIETIITAGAGKAQNQFN